jgi:hypothetical protein
MQERQLEKLPLSQLLEQNALSEVNRQSFSILFGLWVTLNLKIHNCLYTSTMLQ